MLEMIDVQMNAVPDRKKSRSEKRDQKESVTE